MVPQFGQGGTSLPDRDYYLKNDARTLKIQEAFKKYIATLFELIGTPSNQAKSNAEQIFLLEKGLPQHKWHVLKCVIHTKRTINSYWLIFKRKHLASIGMSNSNY